ncbi:MAG: hypothetical protein M3380_21530 [Chloroflexota bacterium]|nr:hypothetical protein [Chloroflexota bacterium]
MQVQTETFRGPRVVLDLRHLLRHLADRLLVIWDGSPIHRARWSTPFSVTVVHRDCGRSICGAMRLT